jgi:hypothetical protein
MTGSTARPAADRQGSSPPPRERILAAARELFYRRGIRVAARRVIALPTDAEQRQRLLEISRSRTEPTSRVERAQIILAYLEEPSAYAVARAIGVVAKASSWVRR